MAEFRVQKGHIFGHFLSQPPLAKLKGLDNLSYQCMRVAALKAIVP